jgi:hypothetical protein
VTRSHRLPPTHREAIRAIFLRRRLEYTMQEAAQLLRLRLGEVLAWVEENSLHVERRRKRRQLGGRRRAMVEWRELASAAMQRWTIVQIHDALGEEANRVLPRLFRPVELRSIRLPEYQMRLLETLALHEGVTLEEYVYDTLLDLEVAADPDTLERLLPGFKEAMAFPEAES